MPAWSVLFPNVETVEPFAGADVFVWTMEPMGPPGAAVQIVYACHYTTDAEARCVSWTPVEGVGNARFEGSVSVAAAPGGGSQGGGSPGGGSQGALSLAAAFDVPAPSFFAPLIQLAVTHEFDRMVDLFTERLGAL